MALLSQVSTIYPRVPRDFLPEHGRILLLIVRIRTVYATSILLASSRMFRNMLDYKLAWKGKELVKVDRFFPSSKKCSKCGKIKKELKLSERVYRCSCGNEMDRDRNAAPIYTSRQFTLFPCQPFFIFSEESCFFHLNLF